MAFRKNLVTFYNNSGSIINRYDVFHLSELAKANLRNNYVEKIKKNNKFSKKDEIDGKSHREGSGNGSNDVGSATHLEDMYWACYSLNTLKSDENCNFLDVNKV